ncbi:MAG: formyltransferase family protein [Pseudomonadota bacterium]
MSMNRRIVFLCGEEEGKAFREHARSLAPDLETLWVSDAEGLEIATSCGAERTRLISFLTEVIVPQSILERLGPTPYNIHPGSPDYPGAHGLSFAIFEGARKFGVTAHEMTARVDTGAIVIADLFDLPVDAEALRFGDEVYARAVSVIDRVIRHCVATDLPMRRSGDHWSARQCTKRRLEALLTSSAHLLPTDIARLERALGPERAQALGDKRKHG